jgi:hypothetical protein
MGSLETSGPDRLCTKRAILVTEVGSQLPPKITSLGSPSPAGTRLSGFPRRRFGEMMPPWPAIRTSETSSPAK